MTTVVVHIMSRNAQVSKDKLIVYYYFKTSSKWLVSYTNKEKNIDLEVAFKLLIGTVFVLSE